MAYLFDIFRISCCRREFGIDDLAEAGYEGDAQRRARNRWLAGLDMNLGDATVYGWRLANPRPVRPAAVKGKLLIFEVDIPTPL